MHFSSLIASVLLPVAHLASATAIPSRQLESRSFPAVCYNNCNNVWVEIQRLGENSSILCAAGSAYRSDRDACEECVAANSGDFGGVPDFIAQAIVFCPT
jgi:hypothetical protein